MRRIIGEEVTLVILVVTAYFLFCHVWACLFYGARFIPPFYWSYATEILSDVEGQKLLKECPKRILGNFVTREVKDEMCSMDLVELDDGRFLALKGLQNQQTNEIGSAVIISKDGKTLMPGPSFPGMSVDFRAVHLLDGTIFFATGSGRNYVFDPRTNKVRAAGSMIMPRQNFAMTCLSDGSVLVCGGTVERSRSDAGYSLTTTMEIYEPKSDKFHFAGHLHQARNMPMQTIRTLNDRRALIWDGDYDEYIDDPADEPKMPYELYKSQG